jgi:hypothetical protein
MNILWQDLVAIGIVTVAVGYLGRAVYRMLFGGKAACGGCGTCPTSGGKTPPLVSLELTGNPSSAPKPSQPGERH